MRSFTPKRFFSLRFLIVTAFGSLAAGIIAGLAAGQLTIIYISVGIAALAVVMVKMEHRRRASLSRAPSWRLRDLAEFCFSKKTFTQVLEPTLSDMQKEHFEALAAGRLWQARMVLVRGYWSFWSAVVAQLPISFARRVYEVWKSTKSGS